MKENLKSKKGITLIALVITIIVLIILAGVSINLVFGQNGLINRAQSAGEEYTKASLKEELEMQIATIQMEKLKDGKKMTREDLKELENIGATMESVETPAEGEYKDYYFEIDENYKVEIIGKLKGEKPSIQGQVVTTGIVQQGGTVEIKVTASISEGSITTLEATNGATLKTETSTTEKTFTVSANGTYTFKVTADNGRSATASVEVNTIIEKPSIEIKDITKTGFTIAVINNYKEGLITEYKYYVGGALKSPKNTTTKEFTVTELTAETEYTNIYVEAYVGDTKVTSEVITATTKPLSTLLTYSWEELEEVAEVISDNDDTITNDTPEVELAVDGKTYKLAVGDIAKVSVDGTELTVRIMGFNHDRLTDTSAYGEGKENKFAGISFEFVDCITNTSINSSSTNSGGWGACKLRGTLNNTTINSLSNVNQIKEVRKFYMETYNKVGTTTCKDKLWLLSCAEIWNNAAITSCQYGYAMSGEGQQYKYYKDIDADSSSANSKLVKNSSSWWLRSPAYYNDMCFCYVNANANGKCGYVIAVTSYGVAPGFSI